MYVFYGFNDFFKLLCLVKIFRTSNIRRHLKWAGKAEPFLAPIFSFLPDLT